MVATREEQWGKAWCRTAKRAVKREAGTRRGEDGVGGEARGDDAGSVAATRRHTWVSRGPRGRQGPYGTAYQQRDAAAHAWHKHGTGRRTHTAERGASTGRPWGAVVTKHAHGKATKGRKATTRQVQTKWNGSPLVKHAELREWN